MLDTMGPEQKCIYLHHARHHIRETVQSLSVHLPPGKGLHVNRQGFVTSIDIDTLPAEALRLRLPLPEAMFAEEDREQRVKEKQRATDEEQRLWGLLDNIKNCAEVDWLMALSMAEIISIVQGVAGLRGPT
ncbi:hypothetical protein TGAM01_v203543 [Trichoderma gamsii]|uniref:Uncharacterized protein n=1 Tax=Trichoderma gamsii TaxID=398673 RepID=A0A2P4ZU10_9HYPO|nr:hypothetical protein TGAM01_v203543 [Trichoderma gamsii]PON27776.1 hypothetical protein TGAM01_v203543 [Trichoderma gamsii]